MKYCDFLQKIDVSETHRGGKIVWVGPMVLALVVAVGCKTEEPTYQALNESNNCLLVDVTDGPAEGDDDDSAAGDDDSAAADDDIVRTELTCCGGDTVIGEGSVIGGNVWLTESIPRFSRVTIESPKLQVHQKPLPEHGDGI